MHIKRYSIAAFVLMAIVGWYVYAYLTHGTMIVDLFGIPLPSLSIALLVVVPLFVLYIASVIHMAFYSMLATLKARKSEKDYEKVFDSVVDAYLGKIDRKHSLKTAEFSLFGNLLDHSTVFPNTKIDLESDDPKAKKVATVLELIENIKNAESVDLKAYSLLPQNSLVIQNHKNMYKNGDITADEVLSHPKKYDKSVCEMVYAEYIKTATVANIDKYKEFLNKDALFAILVRVNADKNTLEISNEALQTLFSNLELDTKEYINISRVTASSMIPDQRIKLFETISNEKEEATDAYLYTLLDLEMLEPAYAMLDISQPDEFQNFKAYRALKECSQPFNLELFI
jgi:hypothetical protein